MKPTIKKNLETSRKARRKMDRKHELREWAKRNGYSAHLSEPEVRTAADDEILSERDDEEDSMDRSEADATHGFTVEQYERLFNAINASNDNRGFWRRTFSVGNILSVAVTAALVLFAEHLTSPIANFLCGVK